MSDDRRTEDPLAEGLLAEDRRARAATGDRPTPDTWLAVLVENEQASERRVRHLAVTAWRTVVALVPLIGVLAFTVRMVSDGWLRSVVRTGAVVLGVLAILALFLAVLATVAWLFRSRSVSLAVIERRLASLEERLARR